MILMIGLTIKIAAEESLPKIDILFDKESYEVNDVMNVTLKIGGISDLAGLQIDIADNLLFELQVETEAFILERGAFSSEDFQVYKNDKNNNISTLIIVNNSADKSFFEEEFVIGFRLLVKSQVTNINNILNITDDFDDIQYNNANISIKISNSSAENVTYTTNILYELPSIELLGDQSVDVQINDVYVEPGCLYDDYHQLFIEGDYDLSHIGSYDLIYYVVNPLGVKSQELIRTINVIDTIGPTFDLIEDQIIEAGTEDIDWVNFIENAIDNSLGEINMTEVSDDILYNIPGDYSVTVKVSDPSSNETSQTFNVSVVDTVPPLVELNPSIDTIEIGDSYHEYGVTAYDVTQTEVNISGTIDNQTEGTYIITYTVIDSSGNQTSLQRYVNVYKGTPNIQFVLGHSKTTIMMGNNYEDGTCLVLVDGVENECQVKENLVNNQVTGIYTITYSYSHLDKEYTYKRYVFVIDEFTNLQLYIPLKKEEGDQQ